MAEKKLRSMKKISVAEVFGKMKTIMKTVESGKTIPVMQVSGITSRFRKGGDDSDKGVWTCFKGRFKAVNLKTGEEFVSANCYLPGEASDEVETAITNGNGEPVEFGYRIDCVADDSNIGYYYQVTSLLEVSNANADNRLDEILSGKAGKKDSAKK